MILFQSIKAAIIKKSLNALFNFLDILLPLPNLHNDPHTSLPSNGLSFAFFPHSPICMYYHFKSLHFFIFSQSTCTLSPLVLWSFLANNTLLLPTLIYSFIQSQTISNSFTVVWRSSFDSIIYSVSSAHNFYSISYHFPLPPSSIMYFLRKVSALLTGSWSISSERWQIMLSRVVLG